MIYVLNTILSAGVTAINSVSGLMEDSFQWRVSDNKWRNKN